MRWEIRKNKYHPHHTYHLLQELIKRKKEQQQMPRTTLKAKMQEAYESGLSNYKSFASYKLEWEKMLSHNRITT